MPPGIDAEALALCRMLLERGISVNHADVAWLQSWFARFGSVWIDFALFDRLLSLQESFFFAIGDLCGCSMLFKHHIWAMQGFLQLRSLTRLHSSMRPARSGWFAGLSVRVLPSCIDVRWVLRCFVCVTVWCRPC